MTSETMFQAAINTALIHRVVNAITAPVNIGAQTLVRRSIRRSVAFVPILMRTIFRHRRKAKKEKLLVRFVRSFPYKATTQSFDMDTFDARLANVAIIPITMRKPKLLKEMMSDRKQKRWIYPE